MRIEVAHDWLVSVGGSERVLETLLSGLPVGRVHTAVFDRDVFSGSAVARVPVSVSAVDRLPGARSNHRVYLPLMPYAVEQYDLRAADVVISNACAVAHGVLTNPDQLHIAYFNRTMTYAWGTYFSDLEAFGVDKGVKTWLARPAYHYLRQWDYLAFQRPDVVVANSRYSARRIAKHYRREAVVLYPPVELDSAPNFGAREDYYLSVGRLVPVKGVAAVVDAFNSSGRSLKVVGTGPLEAELRSTARPNVEFLGLREREELRTLMRDARALVLNSEEDFGLVSVEAQSSGTPVIALRRGGSLETVEDGITGLLFDEPTAAEINRAVAQFEASPGWLQAEAIRARSERFGRDVFLHGMERLIEGGRPPVVLAGARVD